MLRKALFLRFSSFGDIVQAGFAAKALSEKGYKVDLLTKKEFQEPFSGSGFGFSNVYGLQKGSNLGSLWRLAGFFAAEGYELIYDAHNNQRSLLFKVLLLLQSPKLFFRVKTRSKFRCKRLLLFELNLNLFPKPFKGAYSFLEPLYLHCPKPENLTKDPLYPKTILLAPSAAWDLKKWPEDYWVELGKSLIKSHKVAFIGGPQDHFIKTIHEKVEGSENLAGKLNWSETIKTIKASKALVAGDTGVLHIADFFGVPNVALMGPSAFGFPSRDTSKVINKDLYCQPCSKDGRGKCRNKVHQKCLASILPSEVLGYLNKDI